MSKLARSLQQHQNFVARFCCDQTMVEVLLAHHLVRSLLEESVLGDGLRVIDGRGSRPACLCGPSSEDRLVAACKLVVPWQRILQVVGGASFLRVCWGLVDGLNVEGVSLTPWMRALMQ